MAHVKDANAWGRDMARERYAEGGGTGNKPPQGGVKPIPIKPDLFVRDKTGRPTAYDADAIFKHSGIDPLGRDLE
jgi:hypothetical protein